MNYALQKISTVGACDALLESAHKQRKNLERRRRNLGEAIVSFQERLDKMNTERVTVQVLLQSFTPAYALLPEGKDKANLNVAIKRLEVRKALLDKRSLVCNAYTLLKKQLVYNLLHSQVSAMDSYIAAVNERRMDLNLFDLRISRMGVPVDSGLSRMRENNRSAARRETPSYLGLRSPKRLLQPPLRYRVFKEGKDDFRRLSVNRKSPPEQNRVQESPFEPS